MIKTIFTFFQMQIESSGRDAVKLLQASFSIRPKTFYPVNVNVSNGKHIVRMIDSQMLAVTDINQSVITAPAIGMNHAVERNLAANNGLQRFLLHVRHNLGVNLPVAFIDTKDNCFARCSATTLAAHSSSTKIRFVNFDFASRERRSAFCLFSNALTDFQINSIDTLMCQISQLSGFISSQIKRKILDNLPGFSFRYFRIPIISV